MTIDMPKPHAAESLMRVSIRNQHFYNGAITLPKDRAIGFVKQLTFGGCSACRLKVQQLLAESKGEMLAANCGDGHSLEVMVTEAVLCVEVQEQPSHSVGQVDSDPVRQPPHA